ncbi:cyclic nucleotide-binding domain-containing protein [Legionella longbeachae]|uniref:Putative cyclic nucleotide-binding protein n=1 Tax=Legionella longbeachae serogroup 1 (strain NSW150) TaxID=661367 RepID=D3HSL5_LEGLN|nr:cyclic nucleotide-binding domain-containing protein [Legionella longbeachae]VEE02398.1 cyclic nucleotide-binding protein [Legionella oakridgensis]HBD7398111.1 cyclic nucleotide-binding domain-containing protein [Legionella pneumophila]ARB91321.1 cyclic nucleotide-binding domain-containing protein [Legionella longbeachae]ARM32255.1 cyclic nucleotide-binding domain-containing protein [Legionella longbeachae]EEZ94962.1 cyclic nucleotide-binding domain protein [Legionella longbeachae D-4968]
MDNPISENLELFNFMKNLDLFKMLNKNALWPLVNLVTLRQFEPGELIIAENTDPTGIFVVYKGTVEVFKTLQDGSELVITQLDPGQIIGEISVIDKLKTTASVKALDKVECIFISEWDFTTQIHAYPAIGLQLLPVLTHRIRIMYEKIK